MATGQTEGSPPRNIHHGRPSSEALATCGPCPGLRTGIDVTTDGDGRTVASVHVHGLCRSTATVLVAEVDDLLAMGVADVTVHLGAMGPCATELAAT